MERLRVLLIAEAANPEWTSVPLVGWSHAAALRKLVDGHLVTQIRNREAILRAGLVEDRDFTAIDSERLAKPLWKLASLLRGGNQAGWTTMQALAPLSYYYFERLVWKRFGEQIRSRQFDVVHRLTPLSPTTPSILAKRCARAGVPFILGPLNGGIPWPTWFQQERQQEKEWLAPLRAAYKLLPGYRATLKHSAAILAGSRYTMEQIPSEFSAKTHYVPENAIEPQRFVQPRSHRAVLPLQLLFVGRLVPYKGADMALEAAEPLLADGRAQLTIVGDGPQREALQALASRSANPDAIRFAGQVSHQAIAAHFAAADLFIFPSIREFGGGVVLEAMAMGAVPMVVNYGGPPELITPDTGYCHEIGPRSKLIASFRRTLETIAANPLVLREKIAAGQARVMSEFTWDAKAKQVAKIYGSVTKP